MNHLVFEGVLNMYTDKTRQNIATALHYITRHTGIKQNNTTKQYITRQ